MPGHAETHTPGPWVLETVKTQVGICHKVGAFPSRGSRAVTYACVYDDGAASMERGGSPELLANARLIAAAPDLLAALKAMVASYDGLRDSLTSPIVLEKLAHADAAIAKAEGKG